MSVSRFRFFLWIFLRPSHHASTRVAGSCLLHFGVAHAMFITFCCNLYPGLLHFVGFIQCLLHFGFMQSLLHFVGFIQCLLHFGFCWLQYCPCTTACGAKKSNRFPIKIASVIAQANHKTVKIRRGMQKDQSEGLKAKPNGSQNPKRFLIN